MPNTREKLIELIDSAQCLGACLKPSLFDERYSVLGSRSNAELADHLIANGVTVQEWISVKDRLPEPFVDVIAFFGGQEMNADCVDNRGRWYSSYMDRDDPTHWMPLPHPPKGE